MKIKCKKAKARLVERGIDLAKRGGPDALHAALLKANPAVSGWNYDFAADVLTVEVSGAPVAVDTAPFEAFGEVTVVKEDGAP